MDKMKVSKVLCSTCKKFCLFIIFIYATVSKGQTLDDFNTSLSELLKIYQSGSYSQNQEKCSELVSLIDAWFKNNQQDATYVHNLIRYASILCIIGEKETAVKLGEAGVDIYSKLYGEDENYLAYMDILAYSYYEAADYSNSKKTYQRSLELREKLYSTDSEKYAEGLMNIILADYSLANYSEAVDNCLKASKICEINGFTNGEVYDNVRMYYSVCLKALGKYNDAITIQIKNLDLKSKLYGENSTNYTAALTNLSLMYRDIADYKNALFYAKKAIEIRLQLEDAFNSDIASMYINLASMYYDSGNSEQAIVSYNQALTCLKGTYGENHPLYASALDGLATVYEGMTKYDEAIIIGLKALDIRKQVFGTNHPKYIESLFNMSNLYSDYGNVQEALKMMKEASVISKKIYGENHDVYAKTLINMANIYNALGDSEKALENANNALSILKNTQGMTHPDYASCLSTIASIYKNKKDYDKAIQNENEALDIFLNVFGESHNNVAVILNKLSIIYYLKEDYDRALKYAEQSLQIKEKLYGKENPSFANSLNSFALIYHKLGNYGKAIESFKGYTDIVENHLLKMFLGSNASLRETYWNSHAVAFNSVYPSDFFDYWDGLCTDQRDFYAGDVYNKSALFSKGLLLNTELEVSKLIDEANDPEVKQLYTTLKENRDYLSKLYEMEISKRPKNTDSIEQLSQRIELQLHQRLKSFGDYTNNLRTTWRDVQKHLKDGDIAIEFLTSTIDNEDDDMYFALTIKKGDNAPKMIPLVEGKKLKAINKNEIYTTSAMSDLLWKPLKSELNGVTNVYFSPIGVLHTIGIEYLPVEDDINISEKYNFSRLSSTRQLTIERQKLSDWNAVLYGGIQYDADTQTLVAENRQYNINEDVVGEKKTIENNSYAFDNSSVRGGCGYLPGTKVEVENISTTLDSDAIMYKRHIGVSGTEESFKSLSGTKPSVLHIATHGFYWTESDAEKIKRTHDEMKFLNLESCDRETEEDKAMTRSGLMMAGSNRTIKGEKLPSGVDDGILTAKEISRLDLRGLDLVVLSACQTALGDISGSEGVFGLQRAFKKAGAQTLLMSLWKVNDSATEMLMSEFYQNLVSGKSKKQAFIEAQSSLRDIDPDPNHWAAFVMLDSVE